MSREREFRSQPLPGDWALPPEFAEAWTSGEGIDPVALSILKEHEWNGVPIPFAFQTVKECSRQHSAIEYTDKPEKSEEPAQKKAGRANRKPERDTGGALATAANPISD